MYLPALFFFGWDKEDIQKSISIGLSVCVLVYVSHGNAFFSPSYWAFLAGGNQSRSSGLSRRGTINAFF